MSNCAHFNRNVILFHGTCGWELRTAARYVRDNPDVLLYVDSHEDKYNSARNFVSREFLHKRFYGPILRSALPATKRVLALSTEALDFVAETYRVPREALEFYPLGGHVPDDEDYAARRRATRARLGLAEDQIAIIQSGKQTPRKKLIESLDAFAEVDNSRLRLFIAGTLQDSIRDAAQRRIDADDRVQFLGWQDREELTDILCAADVYLQPGTQSATMQQSLCCRCAVIIDDVPAHLPYQRENGWFVSDQMELIAALRAVGDADIGKMQGNSRSFAEEKLDYAVLAKRVLS